MEVKRIETRFWMCKDWTSIRFLASFLRFCVFLEISTILVGFWACFHASRGVLRIFVHFLHHFSTFSSNFAILRFSRQFSFQSFRNFSRFSWFSRQFFSNIWHFFNFPYICTDFPRFDSIDYNFLPCDPGTLTTIIGILILYMEPIMMTSDIVATIINQRHLVRCVQRLETIDHKLRNENISINYRPLQLLSIVLIITLFSRKCLMILFAYCGFHLRLLMLWMKNVPIFASLLSKLWFVLIVANIRRKFEAINHHLNELADSLKATKETAQNAIEANSKIARRDSDRRSDSRESSGNSENISQYLRNEISTRPKPKFFEKMMRSNMNVVQPFDGNNRPIMVNSHISPKMDGSLLGGKVHEITIGDKFDQQLTNLCFVHDEVCEIASIANNMYSFQILILMTHGFLAITAQLYFVYCSLAGQVIPIVIFLYISAKL